MVFGRKKRHNCPNCNTPAHPRNNFCPNCGTSLKELKRKGGKFKNFAILVIILAIVYFSLRFLNGQTFLPISLEDAFNISFSSK